MSTLDERLDALEGRVRRYRNIAVLLAVILAVGLLAGAGNDVDDVIKCRGLDVVNAKGATVASLLPGSHGGVLKINSTDGKPAANLSSDLEGGCLFIVSKDEGLHAAMTATPEGGALLIMSKNANRAAALSATPKGGSVIIWSKDGRKHLVASSGEKGGQLAITDNTATDLVRIHVDDSGQGVVAVVGDNGLTRTLQPDQ